MLENMEDILAEAIINLHLQKVKVSYSHIADRAQQIGETSIRLHCFNSFSWQRTINLTCWQNTGEAKPTINDYGIIAQDDDAADIEE